MSNTIRIRTTPNGDDKYIKVNLEQDFDFIEILSLKISQEDAYTKFCSDYGVIVGRVTVNNGFGVPNAKVSVFIPLDEVDKTNIEIKNIYPYETINDKTSEGIRYNLLSKEGPPDNECFTPIGTFPNKREILDNPTMLEVYCKYYKYTSSTNHAGDFMIFGVPVGTYTVHVDADISDIGIISQRPYDLINQGAPSEMFQSPTKFKSSKNLDKLIQIKTVNSGVNVEPFWGDLENCQIGITRLDIPLNHTITPSAIFTGSIFGDQEKNSVNKNCKPRKELGELCQQIASEGTIEMIRKNFNGDIEKFDDNGGRVIDENGTWSYQVPMNLDYVVTDEIGNLVYVQDPNIGIPTRASVRFKISMDETGGEAKLRTRAKFLVPNNPETKDEIDYSFGPASATKGVSIAATKDSSFKDLYWNKIYTISNYIPRYQKGGTLSFGSEPSPGDNNFIGIKDVDGCSGDKTAFPYNKVNTTINPLFSLNCIVFAILSTLLITLNFFTITAINVMIFVMRIIIGFINSILKVIASIFKINDLKIGLPDYAPCLTIKCPSAEPNTYYAPGCIKSGIEPLGEGYKAAEKNGRVDTDDYTMLKCLAFEMAKSMNMYKYDFYNDWVNGTLFSFLLKYKKKRQHKGRMGSEKFCEFDCDEFKNDENYTGVDSNKNGGADNNCHTQFLLDACISSVGFDCQNWGVFTEPIRSGVVKNVNGELYYAATTHDAKYKLFATDIICLGSVLEYDWQGIPKINQYLTPTTYNMGADVTEFDDNNQVIASGIVDIGDGNGGLFFEIDCIGIHVKKEGCLNLRHACEYGVTLDEIEYTSTFPIIPDNTIGSNDIDDDSGKWFRDVFYLLNSLPTSANSFILPPLGVSTNFNINNKGYYDYTSVSENDVNYLNFRGHKQLSPNSYNQSKHSYYFYFGLIPGKTSLDKMNSSYFTACDLLTKKTMSIDSATKPTGKKTKIGEIIFSFIGGKGPISYTIVGPNYSFEGVTNADINIILSNLGLGVYTIRGTDSIGNIATRDVYVSGPAALVASVYVSKNSLTTTSNDGEITISYILNGEQPYKYVLKNSSGAIIKGPLPASPLTITNLPIDLIGYSIEITDNVGEKIIINKLIVSGVPVLTGSVVKTNAECFNQSSGTMGITVTNGKPPYTITTNGPNGFNSGNLNLVNLKNGEYTTTIVDSLIPPQSVVVTTKIDSTNPEMILTSGSITKQCSPDEYSINLYLKYSFGAPTIAILEYSTISGQWVEFNHPYTNDTTPIEFIIAATAVGNSLKIRAKYNNTTCYSDILEIPKSSMTLPISRLNGNISTNDDLANLVFGGKYKHTINVSGGIGAKDGNPYDIGVVYNNNKNITTTITDSVGCTKTITG